MRLQTCSNQEAILAIKNVLVARALRGASKESLLKELEHLSKEVWNDNLEVRLAISRIKRIYLRA